MDLILNPAEQAVIARMAQLFPERSRPGLFDQAQWTAVLGAGLIAELSGQTTVVSRTLAIIEAARLGSLTPIGVTTLVLPLFAAGSQATGIPAVADVDDPVGGMVRYGADADLLVRYEGAEARLYAVSPRPAQSPQTQYVYPLASPSAPVSPCIGSAGVHAVKARHRLAISAEGVGIMDSVLRRLCAYLTERRQFGRPLAAFQAIQHRLAEMAVDVEMGRWLVLDAAFDDTAASAAIAAAFVARRARRFTYEMHQLAGARGFTLELGLSFDTLRLQALSVEAGGAKAHEADGYSLIWADAAAEPQ